MDGVWASVETLAWLGTDNQGWGRFICTMKSTWGPEHEEALLVVSPSAMVKKSWVKKRLGELLGSKWWQCYVKNAAAYQSIKGGGAAAIAIELAEVAQTAHAAGAMATRALVDASEVKAGQQVLLGTVSHLQDELADLRRAQDSQEGKMPAAVAAIISTMTKTIFQTRSSVS